MDQAMQLSAGTAGSIKLKEDAGMYLLKAIDVSTGKEKFYKVLMQYKDKSAPVISFVTEVLNFETGTQAQVIEEALRDGVTVEDNKDGIMDASKAVISGMPKEWKKGIYTITYTISDSEGNEGSATRNVYIYEKGTPNIIINGQLAMPYGTMVVSNSTIRMKSSISANGNMLMKYRAGIKTAAQMKYGTQGVMLKGTLQITEQTFELPKRSGFYTLYIRTQDRKEQITYVYVDLSE